MAQSNAPSPVAAQTPAPTVTTTAPLPPMVARDAASARDMYEAMQQQRRVIYEQLSSAEDTRDELATQLRAGNVTGADREGLELRLRDADSQIRDLQVQLARARAQEAQSAGLPGATSQPPESGVDNRIDNALGIGAMLLFVFAIPMSLAWARRIWRRNAVTVSLPPELMVRMEGIERAVEATALEVERIGEGQRFVTQIMVERVRPAGEALSAGSAKTD